MAAEAIDGEVPTAPAEAAERAEGAPAAPTVTWRTAPWWMRILAILMWIPQVLVFVFLLLPATARITDVVALVASAPAVTELDTGGYITLLRTLPEPDSFTLVTVDDANAVTFWNVDNAVRDANFEGRVVRQTQTDGEWHTHRLHADHRVDVWRAAPATAGAADARAVAAAEVAHRLPYCKVFNPFCPTAFDLPAPAFAVGVPRPAVVPGPRPLILTITRGWFLTVYDGETKAEIGNVDTTGGDEEERPVDALAVAGDGEFAVTGSAIGTVKVWRISHPGTGASGAEATITPRLVATARGVHDYLVKVIAFHPLNPRVFVSGARDGKVIVWNIEATEQVSLRVETAFLGTCEVEKLALSPDGAHVAVVKGAASGVPFAQSSRVILVLRRAGIVPALRTALQSVLGRAVAVHAPLAHVCARALGGWAPDAVARHWRRWAAAVLLLYAFSTVPDATLVTVVKIVVRKGLGLPFLAIAHW